MAQNRITPHLVAAGFATALALVIFAPAVRSGAIYDDKHVLGNPDVTAPWADAWAGGKETGRASIL